ncbi:hypothetical protein GQ43DRAFT_439590 [Delitschia confertaspora ATCC 74209]|uniref:Uncharacterized protein n=1 Tax=Delitschia confertaspora ATCC 74209 TaxID=1513339 RepID=A0A9P4MWX0_9PLEO|nr:hypothetical protein GQ43DRAFT_439590 [Delitschia confertaspora ATCC 74209]
MAVQRLQPSPLLALTLLPTPAMSRMSAAGDEDGSFMVVENHDVFRLRWAVLISTFWAFWVFVGVP